MKTLNDETAISRVVPFPILVVLCCCPFFSISAQERPQTVRLVEKGKPAHLFYNPQAWLRKDGYLEGSGIPHQLISLQVPRGGSFTMTAKLRMKDQTRSAAGFTFGKGFFGFEGGKANEIFVNGPLFGGYHDLGKSETVFESGSWIDFKVQADEKRLRVFINGKEITQTNYDGDGFERMAFVPWRSTMQIESWTLTGQLKALPKLQNRGYSIPVVDLADDTERQVIVDREAGQYLGHPTTVLLEDGRTIICVYPKGHGRGAIVMKRSEDGGKTWSDRLPTPENWATSKEVPTIYRTVNPKGKKFLIMFSGLYPIRMAVSKDDGQSWSPLEPIGDYGGIVAMGDVVRLKNGDYLAMFHDDGRFFKQDGKRESPVQFHVYQTISKDGGLTWGEPTVVAHHPTAHLCEPGIIRSPNGRQLAVLLRENSRKMNAFVIFSNDEGRTWTKPQELPGSLTGDRHQARYAPDGRLLISFRDTTHVTTTSGDWVAWVGRYEDIVNGAEGEYRIRLMRNHSGKDCAYPGNLLLPDGTFVLTTYGHWTKGEKPYVVSVRLKLSETDRLRDALTNE